MARRLNRGKCAAAVLIFFKKRDDRKMKFSAGYQCIALGELFSDIIRDYREHMGEVYFSYPGIASGRPDGGCLPDKIEQTEYELGEIRKMGISLDLLINGNCYGKYAVSEKFEREIITTIDRLGKNGLFPQVVTTTTAFAAAAVKKYFPEIEVRASVNMRIDSTSAMAYLDGKFDSFYLRRDLQRDIKTVRRFAKWCREHDKKLCLLANSGCLRNCPYQTFHDNLVAHDEEIREIRNVRDFNPHLCWERHRDRAHPEDFLRASWLRPEDIARYAPLVHIIKLATRNTSSVRGILAAYTSGRFDGNMFDLTEPCFSSIFAPQILDNRLLDGVELPGACGSDCTQCGRCREILSKALHDL